MQISKEFRKQVVEAIMAHRENFSGSDAQYAKHLGINGSVYSRLKKGQLENLLSDTQWVSLGRYFNVGLDQRDWRVARTIVYDQIEQNLNFCKQYSKSMILVDDCGIGKSFCAKRIARSMQDTFYLDCSQHKSKNEFIKGLAQVVGMDTKGRYADIKANLKYYLSVLKSPLIVLDESGDLAYNALLELKEIWNGTDGYVGWYMMGADGLRERINRGINKKKVGYAEIFRRFSDEFVSFVPIGREDKQKFYKKLFQQVAEVNVSDKNMVPKLVKRCLDKNASLTHLETLIQVNS